MILSKSLLYLAAGALIVEHAAGMFEKGSPVKGLSPANFDKVLDKTSLPAFVKFYAPWCGHCQNLAPEYERAAKRSQGIAKFYAVNCDEDKNKPLCARYNIQGFPTVKLFTEKRTKKGKRRSVDYQGERTSSAMARFARTMLPNLSHKLANDDVDGFITSTKLPKALLLTERKTTGALWKGVSAQFDRRVAFAHVSSPSQELLEKLGVGSLPAIIVYPDVADAERREIYMGETKFLPLAKFIYSTAIADKTRKTESAGDNKQKKQKAKAIPESVGEIASQEDLEKLCVKPADDSPIPLVCIVGIVPLEPEFEESREEHAKALKELGVLLKGQRLRSRYAPATGGSDANDEDADEAEFSDKPDKEKASLDADDESLSAPLRVSWVNALSPVGQKVRTLFGLSDDLPSAVAINPRKSSSAPYRGAFDGKGLLEWADACYQGRGMRKFLFDLDISARKTEKARVRDEL